MNDLIVLEGFKRRRKKMRYHPSPLRRELSVYGIRRKIKRATKTITAPVVSKVQVVTAPAVKKIEQAAAVASPLVQPIIAPVVNQVQEQVSRAANIAQEYGTEKLKEVKDTALDYAKNPAIQSAAIMAAATALGQPELGQRLASANIQMHSAYDQYKHEIQAIQAINQDPSTENMVRVAARQDAPTATLLRSYMQHLDAKSTEMALRSNNLPADAGLLTGNKWIIGGVLAGGVLLLLLSTQKRK